MAYTESKTDWDEDDEYTNTNQNRVESNIKALAEDNMTISGNKTFTGDNTHSGDNDFSGGVSFSGTIDSAIPAGVSSKTTSGTIYSESVVSPGETSEFEVTYPANVYASTTDVGDTVSLILMTELGEITIVSDGDQVFQIMPGTYKLKTTVNSGTYTLALKRIGMYGGGPVI